MRQKEDMKVPEGKLDVLIPGLGGAVSTTFLAGVEAVRSGVLGPVREMHV